MAYGWNMPWSTVRWAGTSDGDVPTQELPQEQVGLHAELRPWRYEQQCFQEKAGGRKPKFLAYKSS